MYIKYKDTRKIYKIKLYTVSDVCVSDDPTIVFFYIINVTSLIQN